MEIRQIRDFLAVAQAGSFAAASRQLSISQPGLGYQVKQLEDELGALLLVRHSRGVVPTEAGVVFLRHAEGIIQSIAEARACVAEMVKSKRKELRIGLAPTPAQFIGQALTNLQDGEMRVPVVLSEGMSGDLVKLVRRGDLDVAICLTDQSVEGLRSKHLYREYLCLIDAAGGDSSDLSEISLADVARRDIITGPRAHIPRQRLDMAASEAAIELHISQELEPSRLHRSLVLYDRRSTVATVGVFIDDMREGLVRARKIVEPSIGLDIQLVSSSAIGEDLERLIFEAVQRAAAPFPNIIEPAEH